MPTLTANTITAQNITAKTITAKNIGQGDATGPNPAAFVMTVDTTKAGVTASNAIRLPLVSGSSYNFNVDWGDGNSETVVGTTLTQKDHTYASSGIYTVTITGTFPRIYFNNSGDKLKLLTVENLGAVGWTSFAYAFYGCSNNSKVGGTVNWGTVTTCYAAWYNNSLTSWTVSLPAGLTNCSHAWRNNSLTSWTVDLPASLTNCYAAWYGNSLTSWTVSLPAGLTDCQAAWAYNSLTSWTVSLPAGLTNCREAWYNNNLTSWTVSLPAGLTNCREAWYNNNLTSWTVSLPAGLTNCYAAWGYNSLTSWTGGGWAGVTDATQALLGNTLDTTDYNNLLVTIEANNQNNNVPFHGGGSKHSGAGTTARAALVADHTWTVTDGGSA